MTLTQNSNSWSAGSDRRLKDNIEDYSVLGRLDNFRAVSYNWKSNGIRDVGVIAQEIYDIFPEVITRGVDNTDDGTSTDLTGLSDPRTWKVTYDKLGVFALEGVKELNMKVDARTGGLVASGADDIAPLSATTSAVELVTASSTVASTTPWVASFADASQALRDGISSLADTVIHVFTRAFYATVGIFEKIYAKETHTDKLCVSDPSGETCITKAQLDTLLAGQTVGAASVSSQAAAAAGSGGGGDSSAPAPEESAPQTESTLAPEPSSETASSTPSEQAGGDTSGAPEESPPVEELSAESPSSEEPSSETPVEEAESGAASAAPQESSPESEPEPAPTEPAEEPTSEPEPAPEPPPTEASQL